MFMAAAEYLGIDVGGTGVKMGIVHSDTGQISNFQSYDTATWRESHHFLDRLADAIALQLYQHKNVKKISLAICKCFYDSRAFSRNSRDWNSCVYNDRILHRHK